MITIPTEILYSMSYLFIFLVTATCYPAETILTYKCMKPNNAQLQMICSQLSL